MLKREDIERKLERLLSETEKLEARGTLSLNEFRGDVDMQDAVAYSFIVAAQTCMDVAAHVISGTGLRKPQDNPDLFAVLADEGIIPRELAERLGHMVRFRNILTHQYWDVDMDRVHEALRNDLPDLRAFQSAIADWLKTVTG